MSETNIVIRRCLCCNTKGEEEEAEFTYQYPASFWSCKVCGCPRTVVEDVISSETNEYG